LQNALARPPFVDARLHGPQRLRPQRELQSGGEREQATERALRIADETLPDRP
jgi:hypothetical protein